MSQLSKFYQPLLKRLRLESKMTLDIDRLKMISEQRSAHVMDYFLNTEENAMLVIENEPFYTQIQREGDYDESKILTLSQLNNWVDQIQKVDTQVLYLNYLFIEGRLVNGECLKGPVLLIPVQLISSQSGTYLKRHPTRKILLNYPLIYNIAKSKNITLPPLTLSYELFNQQTQQYVKRLLNRLGIYMSGYPKVTKKFIEYTVNSFPKYRKNQLILQPQLILSQSKEVNRLSQLCTKFNQKTMNQVDRDNISIINLCYPTAASTKSKGGSMNSNSSTQSTIVEETPKLNHNLEEIIVELINQSKCTSVKVTNTPQLQSIVMKLLLGQNKILIAVPNNTTKVNVMNELKALESLIFNPTKIVASNEQLTMREVIKSNQRPLTPSVKLKLGERIQNVLTQLSASQLKELLQGLEDIQVESYLKSRYLLTTYPEALDYLTLLTTKRLDEINQSFSELIAQVLVVEPYLNQPFSRDVIACIVGNLTMQDVKLFKAKQESSLAEESMTHPLLTKYLLRKQVELKKQEMQQSDQQIEELYRVFSKLYQLIVENQALTESMKLTVLMQFKAGQPIRQLLMDYHEALLIVHQHKTSLLMTKQLNQQVIEFLEAFVNYDDNQIKRLIKELRMYYLIQTPSQHLQRFNETLTYQDGINKILVNHPLIKNYLKDTEMYQQFIRDLVGNKTLLELLQHHHQIITTLYPLFVLTLDQIKELVPSVDDIVDVVLVDDKAMMIPQDYFSLMNLGREFMTFSLKVMKETPPTPPTPPKSPTPLKAKSIQVSGATQRIR